MKSSTQTTREATAGRCSFQHDSKDAFWDAWLIQTHYYLTESLIPDHLFNNDGLPLSTLVTVFLTYFFVSYPFIAAVASLLSRTAGVGAEVSRENVMSAFTPHTVTEPLGENSARALWSAELSSVGRGQSICRAVPSAARARTAGNRKCDYEGHHWSVPWRGQNSSVLRKENCVGCYKILL